MKCPLSRCTAAQSRADFRSKMALAATEARETHYWLRLACDGKILPADLINPLLDEILSIKRIITSIVISTAPDGRNSGC